MDENTQSEQQDRLNGTSLNPPQFLLDSNIFDKLAAEPALFIRELRQAVIDDGSLRLCVTHIQNDELNRIKDSDRREELRSLLTTLTEQALTSGGVYGVSSWDQATLADENDTTLADWMNGNAKHAEDALIATTARDHGFILVTQDQRMTKRAQELGVTVWDYARFRRHICGHA